MCYSPYSTVKESLCRQNNLSNVTHSLQQRMPGFLKSAPLHGLPPCSKENCGNSLQRISKENGVYFRSTPLHGFRDLGSKLHFEAACKPLAM